MIEYLDKLEKYANFIQFRKSDHLSVLLNLPHSIVAAFTGNQGGKTANVAYLYIMRILGLHPIAEKNRLAKNIRCLSSSYPESSDPHEGTNTQYLELKRLLPPELIIKDINNRNRTLVVSSPTHGKSYIEFISYNQDIYNTARVQRCSLWEDEEVPKAYREESRRRLLSRQGDEIITLTPKNGLTYLYDDVWNKKSWLWRSPTIQEALKLPAVEKNPAGDPNIACIQFATDDNPTMTKAQVDANFAGEDKDEVMVSRYGVFRQIAGTVHKAYNHDVHFIPFKKYFPNGIPYEWTHARGIDYHESRVPWSIGWMSVSPANEWFLWQEFHAAIDGPNARSSYEIALGIARRSADYIYRVNLIDPLARKKQSNTNTSVVEDLNRYMKEIRFQYGLGTRHAWEPWDTKGTGGRDEIHQRLKNAYQVKRPFNNEYREHGERKFLPTLWICDTCPNFDISIRRWSYEEWASSRMKTAKDAKATPNQKYSHDNMVLECLAKDARLGYRRRPVFARKESFSPTGGGSMVYIGEDNGSRIHRSAV